MKFKLFFIFSIIVSAVFYWYSHITIDQSHQLIIEENVGLFKTAEAAAYSNDKPFLIVSKNENVTVKQISYGKDYMAIKIEISDGKIGWLVCCAKVTLIKPENIKKGQ